MIPHLLEGALVVRPGSRFAIVASRFNHFIVDKLVDGALDAIVRHGGDINLVHLARVPGAWEIPHVANRLAKSGKVDVLIALAAVIRGSTPHFDHVCSQVSKGVSQVSLDTGVFVSFGVLTTDSIDQAIERAGTKSGNKGFEAAVAAIELVSLSSLLSEKGF